MLIDSTNIQFKEYSQGMDSLFPSRLDENISSDAPVRLANQLVDEFDISLLLSTYKGGCCPAYYSRMLLKVLFFAYLPLLSVIRKSLQHYIKDIYYSLKYLTRNTFLYTILPLLFLNNNIAIISRVEPTPPPFTILNQVRKPPLDQQSSRNIVPLVTRLKSIYK